MTNMKVAIVTGASSGIGRQTALALARRGYAVLLAARRVDRLEQIARCCDDTGGAGRVVPTDVADLDWDGDTTETVPKDLYFNTRKVQFVVDMRVHETPRDFGGPL